MKKQEKKSAMSKKSLAMIQKPVIVEPLLAKSSSRVWQPDSRGGYPPHIAGGFLLPCSWAHCIQSIPVSIALSMGQLCGRLHACRFPL